MVFLCVTLHCLLVLQLVFFICSGIMNEKLVELLAWPLPLPLPLLGIPSSTNF